MTFSAPMEHVCFRSMPVAALKSMSDVVTRGLICEADPWETEREPERDCQKEGGRKIGSRSDREIKHNKWS